MKGGYVLVIELGRHVDLAVNKSRFEFNDGIYLYSGSALGPGGIEARIRRHLRLLSAGNRAKRRHWHIDWLLAEASAVTPVWAESKSRTECILVSKLRGKGCGVIMGFGNTDCSSGCGGHLLRAESSDREKNVEAVANAFAGLGLKPETGKRHVLRRFRCS